MCTQSIFVICIFDFRTDPSALGNQKGEPSLGEAISPSLSCH